jgi:hypothetical protein
MELGGNSLNRPESSGDSGSSGEVGSAAILKSREERLIEAFVSRRPEVDSEMFCPKCRGNREDRWWKICNKDMTNGGHVIESQNKGYCEMHAGELNRTLQEHFTAEVRVTAAAWNEGVSDQIYNQMWTSANEDDAWHFSRKVQRGLDCGKLELVYKETSSKNRVFGLRCQGCKCGIVLRYRPGLTSRTQKLLQFAFGSFLDNRVLLTDPDGVANCYMKGVDNMEWQA